MVHDTRIARNTKKVLGNVLKMCSKHGKCAQNVLKTWEMCSKHGNMCSKLVKAINYEQVEGRSRLT